MFASWGPLYGPLGALLGRLGGLVGRLEAILDRRGATLGRLDALFDSLGAQSGLSWAVMDFLGGSGGPGGALMSSSPPLNGILDPGGGGKGEGGQPNVSHAFAPPASGGRRIWTHTLKPNGFLMISKNARGQNICNVLY